MNTQETLLIPLLLWDLAIYFDLKPFKRLGSHFFPTMEQSYEDLI